MRTERVQAFSDGIFAILITILVLEFKVPKYVEGNLTSSIIHYWPILFAYILTYFISVFCGCSIMMSFNYLKKPRSS